MRVLDGLMRALHYLAARGTTAGPIILGQIVFCILLSVKGRFKANTSTFNQRRFTAKCGWYKGFENSFYARKMQFCSPKSINCGNYGAISAWQLADEG